MNNDSDIPPPPPPTSADIDAAAMRLYGVAVRTPLLECPRLNARCGTRILVKAEMLQHTGSFKFRGAFNRLIQLSVAEQRRGVVAFSSGNHAMAVAAAAARLGIAAHVVMPADAPAPKVAGTRAFGANITFYDRDREDREAVAAAVAAESGAAIVKPFDDVQIIAGQGTLGREVMEDCAARGVNVDAVLVPCSGGGLVAGVALAFGAWGEATKIYAVEPKGFDDTARSLAAGERVRTSPGARTISDALMVPSPGKITFAINRHRLSGGLVVDDAATLKAMAVVFDHFRLVVEPGGAVALAALLSGAFDGRGKTVAVVLSGGNVDRTLFREALTNAAAD